MARAGPWPLVRFHDFDDEHDLAWRDERHLRTVVFRHRIQRGFNVRIRDAERNGPAGYALLPASVSTNAPQRCPGFPARIRLDQPALDRLLSVAKANSSDG